jgi:hypothetical protein
LRNSYSKIPELEEHRAMLAELTPYATEYRYPGKAAGQEDAKACVDLIRKLRNAIRPMLTPA